MNVRHNSMWERDLRRKKISFVSNISSLETQQSCWNKAVNARKPLWFGGSLTGTRSQGNIEGQWNLMISTQGKHNPAQTKVVTADTHCDFLVLLLQVSKFFKRHLKGWNSIYGCRPWNCLLLCPVVIPPKYDGMEQRITGRWTLSSDLWPPRLCDLGQLTQSLWTIFVPSLKKQQLSGRGDL